VKSPDRYALTVEEARAIFRHTHGRYLDADRDDIVEFLQEIEYSDGPGRPSTPSLSTSPTSGGLDTGWGWVDLRTHSPRRPRPGGDEKGLDALRLAVHTRSRQRDTRAHHTCLKGAEAGDVVVYDGITGRISRELDERATARENEARTWYVALTRASKRLHIIRGAFDWTDAYLPSDLEPRAAKAALNAAVTTDGGESDGA